MKVLMICTEKLPVPEVRGGAIQTYISGILPYLSQYVDLTILGVNDPELPDSEVMNGVTFARIPGREFNLYAKGVVDFVKSHSFDLIHIFNRPKLVLPIRQVAPRAKIILSMHNDMFVPTKIPPEEARAVIREVSRIVTISSYIGKAIEKLYPEASGKWVPIYSGVDSERFMPGSYPSMKKNRDEIRKEHGLEKKTVLLYAGRLSSNKGVDRLLLALPEIAKKHKNVALIIVGSKWFSQNDVSDYVAYVRSLANRLPVPVVSTGFVSPFDIQNWFAAADLFVCTSIWNEPLARVHYEAMAAGLPIVTTNRGGNPEVITPGENGLVVEQPENPQEFAEKILEIINNPELMRKMGERNRQLAETNFNWQRVAGDVLKVWGSA